MPQPPLQQSSIEDTYETPFCRSRQRPNLHTHTLNSEMDRIPVALQPKALLMHPSALAKHFRNLIDSDASVENLNFMNSLILEQTHKEAIPSTVYYVWLCMVYRHSSHFLPSALQDETSAGVRSAGIKVTQRIFRSRDWKRHGWDALGGAEGIKTILDRLPLAQVRLLIGAISHCHSARDRQLMATCFDELVTLLEGSDSWTERCLLRYASRLYGKCSSRKAMEALKSSSPGFTGLSGYHAQLHMDLLRQIAIGTIDMPPHVRKETLTRFQSDLLHSWQAYDPIYVKGLPSDTFPGVAFGIDMLQLIAKDPRLQCGYTFGEYETSIWVRSVLKLAIRRCESFDVILLIITTEPVFSRSRQFDYVRPFLPERVIIQLWSLARFGSAGSSLSSFGDIIDELRMREACRPTVVHRAALEDCLIKHVIQAAAGDCALQPRHPEFTKKVARLLWLVASEGRFDFLQLLCRHLPTLRFDITAWPPSEEERQLVPTWGHAVLQRLSLDSSKSLFERSLHVFHCEEFLPDLDGTQRRCFPSWEEQCQLWADWESSAAKTVDDLRVTRKGMSGPIHWVKPFTEACSH